MLNCYTFAVPPSAVVAPPSAPSVRESSVWTSTEVYETSSRSRTGFAVDVDGDVSDVAARRSYVVDRSAEVDDAVWSSFARRPQLRLECRQCRAMAGRGRRHRRPRRVEWRQSGNVQDGMWLAAQSSRLEPVDLDVASNEQRPVDVVVSVVVICTAASATSASTRSLAHTRRRYT